MEDNSAKSMIIEFNGLPGTGKSTISEELKKRAEREGLRVCTNYGNEELSILSPLLRIRNYSFLPSLLLLGRMSDMSKNRLGQILRCLGYIERYVRFSDESNHSTILLLDEGIIQALVSIAYLESFKGKEKRLKKIFNNLLRYNVQWYSVNCISNPLVSFERVIQRGNNQGRMDQLKKAELMNALKFQVESFDIVRKEAMKSGVLHASIDIDTKQIPGSNAELILNMLINNTK